MKEKENGRRAIGLEMKFCSFVSVKRGPNKPLSESITVMSGKKAQSTTYHITPVCLTLPSGI